MRLVAPMVALAVTGLVLFAGSSDAQDGEHAGASTGGLDDPRLAAVRTRLEAAARAADAEHLPAAWLFDKIAEGLAKGVGGERIAQAVDRLHGRMQGAARIVGRLPHPPAASARLPLLRALVDAMAVGASEHALARLAQVVAHRDVGALRPSVVALAELGERGFSPEDAMGAVTRAFQHGGGRAVAALVDAADNIGPGDPGKRGRALREVAEDISTPRSTAAPLREDARPEPGRGAAPPHDNSFGRARARARASQGPPITPPGKNR